MVLEAPPNNSHIPENIDLTEKPYVYRGDYDIKETEFSSVNLWEDHHAWLSPIYNQSHTLSCTANAVAAAVRYMAHKLRHENPSSYGLPLDPSRLFIYYNGRAVCAMRKAKNFKQWPIGIGENGVNIESTMRAINFFGVAAEQQWPWIKKPKDANVLGILDRPRDSAYIDAWKTQILEHYSFGSVYRKANGLLRLTQVKQCLSEGYPVVFELASFWRACRWSTRDGSLPALTQIPLERKHDDGGHSVLAVGFDEKKQGILVQNSWGEKSPHFWVPYEWIKDYDATHRFWMFRITHAFRIQTPYRRTLDLMWTLRPSSFKLSKLKVIDCEPAMTQSSTITSISRRPNSVEIFWIAEDGKVESRCFHEGSLCERTSLGVVGAATGGITSVLRNPDNIVKYPKIEAWWIATYGSVRGSRHDFVGQKGWQDFTVSSPGRAIPGAGITSINRCKYGKGPAVVFWIGPQGSIWKTSWGGSIWKPSPTGNPDEWLIEELAGKEAPKKRATALSSITAESISCDHMVVWWITEDEHVQGRWYKDGGRWQRFSALKKPHNVAIGSRMSCISRYDGNMELFFIETSGQVRRLYWNIQESRTPKLDIPNLLVGSPKARVDSDIKAISISKERIDVVWVGSDDTLECATFEEGNTPQWRALTITQPGSVMAGSPLGIFSMRPNEFSVCFRDYQGDLVLVEYK